MFHIKLLCLDYNFFQILRRNAMLFVGIITFLLINIEGYLCHEIIKRQFDETPNIIQNALNKYYGYQYRIIQLPRPRIRNGYCSKTPVENSFYMADILGQITSLMEEDACVSACIQNRNCLSVNYLSYHKRCILLASGLTLNDLYNGNYHDIFYSTQIQSRHLVLDSCVDEFQRPVSKNNQPQKNTTVTDDKECGKQFYQPTVYGTFRNRITGGTEAAPHSWPWIVSLQSDGVHICGGTILPMSKDQSDIVLTAAHCFVNRDGSTLPVSALTVQLGSHSLSYIEHGEQTVSVERYVYSSQYNRRTLIGDVALIKLYAPVKFSNTVIPVCLSMVGEGPEQQSTCVVAGWGNLIDMDEENYPDKLQQLRVPVIEDSVCINPDVWGYDFNTSARMCAGYLAGKMNMCSGDSGGPLICYTNGYCKQYGVASFVSGQGCRIANKPGVFSRVSTYYNWIIDNANRMSRVGKNSL